MREVDQPTDGAREVQVVVWAHPEADDNQVVRYGPGDMSYEEAAPGADLPAEGIAEEQAEEIAKVDFTTPPKVPEGRPVPEPRRPGPRPKIAGKGGAKPKEDDEVF